MLASMKTEVLALRKNILNHNLLLKKNAFQRLLYASHCKNVSSVLQFEEDNNERNKNMELANTDEKLPSLRQTNETALLEPIRLIPASVRHLQDIRILYSSLFPKYYSTPFYIKYDLRDVHVTLVKDKMKEKAVDAVIAEKCKESLTSEMLKPSLELVKEAFPYEKSQSVLTCSKNAFLTYIEKHKVNYEALPEVDRKKELAALLEEYDSNNTKPLMNLAKPNKGNVFMKYSPPVNETSQLQEHPCDKNFPTEELKSADKHTELDTSVLPSDKTDQEEYTYSSQVASTNVNLADVKVCSKCKILLDPPMTSNTLVNFYTEERSPASSDEQQNQLCQRCNFDVVHSSAAHVLVPPDSYVDMLRPMSTRYSLVLLVLDLMDAPCSIHPSIMDVIGRNQPVIVVANKVDLLPLDAKQALRTMWHTINAMVKSSRLSSANIIDTVIVSAKTGFGITELRTLLQGQWRDNGDVFLVGGAGCGKTSLFKALADSIGVHEHVGLARRVQTYNWPLTSLGLLKFEMKRVHGELRCLERGDLVERTVRPFKRVPRPVALRPFIPARPDDCGSSLLAPHAAPPMLSAQTGEVATSEVGPFDLISAGAAGTPGEEEERQKGAGAWLYDTPSAVMPMQILDLLTEEEIELLTPRTKITPQTFRLEAGRSLFLAGLARIDVLYLHHPMPKAIGWQPHDNAKLTVYAAKRVPRTLVRTVDASSVYRDHLGDEMLMIPSGSAERMSQWPLLAPQNFTATGPNYGVAAADIVLPSLGFVSVWLHPLTVCSLRVWTPGGRGAFLRSQSLLPYAIHLKGPAQKRALVYGDHVPFEESKAKYDPSVPPSDDRLDDVDPLSLHVKVRDRLGYQPKDTL